MKRASLVYVLESQFIASTDLIIQMWFLTLIDHSLFKVLMKGMIYNFVEFDRKVLLIHSGNGTKVRLFSSNVKLPNSKLVKNSLP